MKLFISPTPPEGSRQRIQFPVFPLRIIYTITGSRRKTKAVILADSHGFHLSGEESVKAAVAIRETKPAPAMSRFHLPAVRGRNTDTDISNCREVSRPLKSKEALRRRRKRVMQTRYSIPVRRIPARIRLTADTSFRLWCILESDLPASGCRWKRQEPG